MDQPGNFDQASVAITASPGEPILFGLTKTEIARALTALDAILGESELLVSGDTRDYVRRRDGREMPDWDKESRLCTTLRIIKMYDGHSDEWRNIHFNERVAELLSGGDPFSYRKLVAESPSAAPMKSREAVELSPSTQ